MIEKIRIENYRRFGSFELALEPGTNIVVGDNGSGKSTLLEAISLALTGRLGRVWFANELLSCHFNQKAIDEFVDAVKAGEQPAPPQIRIELFLADREEFAFLKGKNNSLLEDAPGICLEASLDNATFSTEYEALLANPGEVDSVPVEYYQVEWRDFGDHALNARRIPIRPALVDSSSIRLHSGVDFHVQRTIEENLDPVQKARLATEYRALRVKFAAGEAIVGVNEKLTDAHQELTGRALTLEVDGSRAAAWERSLIPHIDALPFHFNGMGIQHQVKILLALARSAERDRVVLLEEPENHLSPSSLRNLLASVDKVENLGQAVVTTHSSFVINKLGLGSLILLSGDATARLTDLPPTTESYFKRLPGFDTLRLVLAKETVLVEGPSDELIFARAYRDETGREPIEDGLDVICVRGLSHGRFLDIALALDKPARVILDNDGKPIDQVRAKFGKYVEAGKIKLFVGDPELGETLEPQLVNAAGREALNSVLDKEFVDEDSLTDYMTSNKTECALAIFERAGKIEMPPYIQGAVLGK